MRPRGPAAYTHFGGARSGTCACGLQSHCLAGIELFDELTQQAKERAASIPALADLLDNGGSFLVFFAYPACHLSGGLLSLSMAWVHLLALPPPTCHASQMY